MNDIETFTAEELTDVADQLAKEQDAEQEPFVDAPDVQVSVSVGGDFRESTDAIASELANVAQQYDNMDAEKRAEGVDVAPVFDDGPYDPKQALSEIFAAVEHVEEASREYLVKKEDAKDAKDALDERQETLNRLICRYRDRSRGVKVEQPPLKTLDPAESIAARDTALQSLSFALLGRQCFIEVADLATLSDQDRGALQAWATSTKKGPVLPMVLATAHVAREDGIACRKCGLVFFRGPDDPLFAAQSLHGLDCKGVDLEDARPVKKRGSKKAKKIDHDAERQQQTTDKATRAKKGTR